MYSQKLKLDMLNMAWISAELSKAKEQHLEIVEISLLECGLSLFRIDPRLCVSIVGKRIKI